MRWHQAKDVSTLVHTHFYSIIAAGLFQPIKCLLTHTPSVEINAGVKFRSDGIVVGLPYMNVCVVALYPC